jgi:hypothetical protein
VYYVEDSELLFGNEEQQHQRKRDRDDELLFILSTSFIPSVRKGKSRLT